MDLWGPYKVASLSGTCTYLLHNKQQVASVVKGFVALVQTQFGFTPKRIRRGLDKFDPKGRKSILLGYPAQQKGYRLFDLATREVYHNMNVVFQESKFPFKEDLVYPNSCSF
ncbi:hypothetical protein V2J09_000718 [Rumex salicifolius]